MIMQLLAPLFLPVLQLVTLATVPLTAIYAIAGLLLSPITIPLLIISKAVKMILFTPLFLLVSPLAIPAGGVLAFLCTVHEVACSLFTVFTPLLWPVCFFMKWWKYSCLISQVIVMDTIFPFLAPLRWAVVTAMLPKAMMK